MRIVRNVEAFEEKIDNLVLTIGSFDGVHLGHQRILAELRRSADVLGGQAGLMTLDPHPRHFFSPENAPNLLTSLSKKAALVAGFGVDILFVLPFDGRVADLDPLSFVRDILVGRCGVRRIIVGHDFAFGRDASGDYAYLSALSESFGFEVEQLPQLIQQGEGVSSTRIREKILQGELAAAERLLGRRYAIEGRVVTGRGIGRKLNFPTANIAPHHSATPAQGVYAAKAYVGGAAWKAAVNIGVAPTIRHEDVVIEAHLLDFKGDIVGEVIEIEFYKRLRPEQKFSGLDALIDAIAQDVAQVRVFFEEAG